MKVAVVTAIYGGIDNLLPHPPIPGVDFIAYVDQPTESEFWEVRCDGLHLHPRLAAKTPKLFAGRMHPEYDYTIWVDGSHEIISPTFVEGAVAAIGESGIALYQHPWRDCIYAEAWASFDGLHKYDGLPLFEQVDDYHQEGHPEHWGLWATGTLARRNTEAVEALMWAWMAEIEKWTIQDQLSFPVVCRRAGIRPDIFPHHQVFDNPWTAIRGHLRED